MTYLKEISKMLLINYKSSLLFPIINKFGSQWSVSLGHDGILKTVALEAQLSPGKTQSFVETGRAVRNNSRLVDISESITQRDSFPI